MLHLLEQPLNPLVLSLTGGFKRFQKLSFMHISSINDYNKCLRTTAFLNCLFFLIKSTGFIVNDSSVINVFFFFIIFKINCFEIIWYALLKCLGSKCFLKEAPCAHQGCIYFIKTRVKTVILWKMCTIYNNYFLFLYNLMELKRILRLWNIT